MYVFVLVLHLFVCLGLVCVVLLQSGKGGGLAGGAFGGTAQTVFGGRGATDFMTRATMILGTLFFITSISLALMSTGSGGRSLMQEQARRSASTATTPSTPARTPSATPAQPLPTTPAPTTPAPATPAPGGR